MDRDFCGDPAERTPCAVQRHLRADHVNARLCDDPALDGRDVCSSHEIPEADCCSCRSFRDFAWSLLFFHRQSGIQGELQSFLQCDESETEVQQRQACQS